MVAQRGIVAPKLIERGCDLAVLTPRAHRLHQPFIPDQRIDDQDDGDEDEQDVNRLARHRRSGCGDWPRLSAAQRPGGRARVRLFCLRDEVGGHGHVFRVGPLYNSFDLTTR